MDDRCTPGAEKHSQDNLRRALDYLADYFKSLGYSIHKETVTKRLGYNLIATKPGAVYPSTILEIGAHIDSHDDSPGASDNASGVAAVMEIAAALQQYPNQNTWRFVIFVGEEDGLVGSMVHAGKAAELGENIRMALILDAIGWSEIAPRQMNCIWSNPDMPATVETAHLFDQARRELGIDIGWRLCGGKSSQGADHLSYWHYKYPAVLSVGGYPYTSPTYHQCDDAMTTVDLANAFKTTQQNLAVLLLLDYQTP
jgi:hypothetical protein